MKTLQMSMPETVFQHDAEKKRIKKGILGGSEERMIFAKTLYLPYGDFSYQYYAEKGHLSKQTVQDRGRSVVLALREADFGFNPELLTLIPQVSDVDLDSGSIVEGVDSMTLVRERLDELKRMLHDYDLELHELSKQSNSLLKTNHAKLELQDNIDHLKKARETRWKMFSDGLKLPSKVDWETLELLTGTPFYIPYFMVKFTRTGESRFLVWDRDGRENDLIAEELAKNGRFRDLIQYHALRQDT